MLFLDEEMEKRVSLNIDNSPPLPTQSDIPAPEPAQISQSPDNSLQNEIIAYCFPPTSGEVRIGKLIEKRESELLIHPASSKEKFKKNEKYISYFFHSNVEKMTIGPKDLVMSLKLNANGALSQKSLSQLGLVLGGRKLV